MRFTAWGLALALASGASAFALGCGSSEPPEQRLEEAGEALSNARESLSEARERRDAAQQELAEARKALRRAERAVLSAAERVERRATDVALFRAVQAALLEDPALRQEAISARVDDARVTVEGEVSDAALRERALEVARSQPGVAGVRDEIEVVEGEAANEG